MPAARARGDYSLGEEIANSVSHGIGVPLSVAGLVALVAAAAVPGGDGYRLASAIVWLAMRSYSGYITGGKKEGIHIRFFDHFREIISQFL